MKQVMDATDVIVRTDDFEGKRVKLHVEKGLPCLSMDTLKYSNDFLFEFGGTTVTNLEYGLGADYLFDGDKYGLNYRRNRLAGERYKYNTYVVGPHAFYNKEEGDKNRFILDLKQERVPAGVFIYAFLNYRTSWPYSNDRGFSEGPEFLQDVWKGYYISRLPAKAKLYGTNSMNPQSVDLASCTLLSELDDDIDGVFTSWAARSDCNNLEIDDDWMKGDEEELLATEPVVLRMLCNYEEGRKFRYLILVVTDTYNSTSRLASMKEVNSREFVTFNEMEVCVKAE
ncbi:MULTISPECIES: hypothetical protein [Butyricimonas]|uniref:hypothetical protein n=1 Tax=Butyricimonas TaxID=574697 RepID=UPI0007FB2C59|nr:MULTISPECIES: hypothetical protein [Butyricimonas]